MTLTDNLDRFPVVPLRPAIISGLDLPDPWRLAEDGVMTIGSEAHKRLFCKMLTETFNPYRPAIIPWPKLSADALDKLRSLPFWDLAVETEGNAAIRMQAMADCCDDVMIREALALNAYEENRHKVVIADMIGFYGIALKEEKRYLPPPDPEYYFLRTGYGECLDSFFAFGLFQLARESGFFPEELVEVFEPVIQEEARHLLFFVNWVAWSAANRRLPARTVFWLRRMRAIGAQIAKRAEAAKLRKGKKTHKTSAAIRDSEQNFTTAAKEIGINVKPRAFLELCLKENSRRMAIYDDRLLHPTFWPRVSTFLMPLLRV